MKIFLSCVSAQFKACRDALASDLRAIGCEACVQEDLQQGSGTLLERLEGYVARCERVIALVGDAYGFEAPTTSVSSGSPPRSYTQWEYAFGVGERLNGVGAARKDLLVYFASDPFLLQHPVPQTDDQVDRQRLFAEAIKASGKHWDAFDTPDQLCRLVLRDGWQMQERPPKPRNLPYDSIGALFTGRDAFLRDLEAGLGRQPGRATTFVGKQVVFGLGGVGKTRLAVEYALRRQDDYSAFLFVVADSRRNVSSNLAALSGPLVLNLREQDTKEENVRVAGVLRWLDKNSGWFLLFDSVDTPNAAAAVERLLPLCQGGHVIITSRVADWSAGVQSRSLDVLIEDDSVSFLLARTDGRRRVTLTDAADARTLARDLDGLALALEQAAAFVGKLRVSLSDYVRRWHEHDVKVREWHDARLMTYPLSVATTWDATIEQLEGPARALLQMLCWFAPDAIPRAVLESETAQMIFAGQTEAVATATNVIGSKTRSCALEDALAELAAFSLVKWGVGNETFRIHRLIQEVTRDRLSTRERETSLRTALEIVNRYLTDEPAPDDIRAFPRWEPMRGHAAVLVAAADAAGIGDLTSHLMNELGLFLYTKGVWAEAEVLFRRALAIDEKRLGSAQSAVVAPLTNLGSLLSATNRLTEAELLMRRALTITQEHLGPDHPEVATALNNLGVLLQATNRPLDAKRMLRRAVKIDEEAFGPNDPRVVASLNNLASALHGAEAETLFRRALAIAEEQLGPLHLNVAACQNNLAQFLEATGRQPEAEPLMRSALAIHERTLGLKHPFVATSLSTLASLLQNTNRQAEAESLMWRALAITEGELGLDHSSVAGRLNNLGLLLKATGRANEAEPLMRRAVDILATFTRRTGREHPKLGTSVVNYGAVLKAMGFSPREVLKMVAEAVGEVPASRMNHNEDRPTNV